MKLKDQIVSLELAKKLKILGIKQESLFFWANYKFAQGWCLEYCEDLGGANEYISAFTVAELGELLMVVGSNHEHCFTFVTYHIPQNKKSNKWRCSNGRPFDDSRDLWLQADTEANARAKMLICVIKEGIIKA